MKKEFNFEKKGYRFCFRNPKLNRHNKMVLEWKIIGQCENEHDKEGYYFNAEFSKDKDIISLYSAKIENKKINGVILPKEIFDELLKAHNQLLQNREQEMDVIIGKVINGEILIDFKITTHYYTCYIPTIDNLPENLKELDQDIIEKAILKCTDNKFWWDSVLWRDSVYDFLKKKLNMEIATEEEARKDIVNLRFDKKIQEAYNYKSNVITSFQIKLSDLIDIEEIKAATKKRKEENEAKEKRKNSLTVEILKKGRESDDHFANVRITDPRTNESLKFRCRNIFDFGYVVNPDYEIMPGKEGGLASKGKWETFESEKGWYPVRELTEFEKRCIDYLHEFSPIDKEIRM